jgi:tetratricopeptide (TPR) repeat protein
MMIARAYVQEGDWPTALQQYERWLAAYTNHPARPQVEFDRALTYYQSGQETNALSRFTNIVSQFPASDLAPWAQYWIADYYFRQGDYQPAEINYQLAAKLVQNQLLSQPMSLVGAELGFRARLKAGQCALLRDKPSDAPAYLTNLINDPNCPPDIRAEAYFILGDVALKEAPPPGATNSFEGAIKYFNRILVNFPTNRLEPLARGKIADCYLQWAAQDTNKFLAAANEYRLILASPLAEVPARSQAEVGLAIILEKQARQRPLPEQRRLLDQALQHCLNVFHGKHVRKNERPDQFWFKEAGLMAGRLAEQLQQVPQAISTYERLVRELPALRANLEKKLEALKSSEIR